MSPSLGTTSVVCTLTKTSSPAEAAVTSVDTALRHLLETITPLPAEPVPIGAAAGRVLAEPVMAATPLPGFDNSAMDGYALQASAIGGATPEAPAVLPVRGEARTGHPAPQFEPGTAVRIMTGAALPQEADTVVRQEDVRRDGGTIAVSAPVALGTNVRRRGEDIAAGEIVLEPGRWLTAIDVGVAAALGRERLLVHRRPRVAILATGDELVPAGSACGPSQIADANSPMLAAAVIEAGGEPVMLGIAGDDPETIREHIQAPTGYDLIISSAGVSVGDHDHVRAVLDDLGSVGVWRIAMRPGKPLLIGRLGGVPYLGLPGNPVSSSVTFELFGRPAIRALQGAAALQRRRLHVHLAEAMAKPVGLRAYVRGVLADGPGGMAIGRSAGSQGSGMLHSLARADCLLVLDEQTAEAGPGTVVEAIPLR